MGIKDKFSQALKKASLDEEKSKAERKTLEVEAQRLFKPIAEAMEQLSQELSGINGLSIKFSANNCMIRLGNQILESCRYFFDREYSVRETNRWGEETLEQIHHFETSEQVIEFLVEMCAKYAAQKSDAAD
jgi:hypothetical protein